MPVNAKVIQDSVFTGPGGNRHRLTTFEATFHRFVLSEWNTHRAISKNSASSRAIPLSKSMLRLRNDSTRPVSWPAEKPGMQGGAELDTLDLVDAQEAWGAAMEDALEHAETMRRVGLHKSVANRILEPFSWHTAVMSGTAWDNVWKQRISPLAQPEIRVVATAMKAALDASTPVERQYGPSDAANWHLPYVTDAERSVLSAQELVRLSSARCARVSYLTQDGSADPKKDHDLYDRLVSADPPHFSPLEHVATPDGGNEKYVLVKQSFGSRERVLHLPAYGNFLDWHQHRADVEVGLGVQSYS